MDRKERDRILSLPFDLFPRKPGIEYGARPHQKAYFINRYGLEYRRKKFHTHSQDVLLSIGGARSGKTFAAIAATIDSLLRYPGSQALIGAKTYQDLKDMVIEHWQERFTIDKAWDHPLVESKPTDHNKILRLINGSFARFMHFDDFERLRGREAAIIHLDEASQMEDARAFQELVRRLSSTRIPIRQLILTTNPPESANWLHDVFALQQFMPGYEGPPIPIGEKCRCQFCQDCLNKDDVEILWEGGICPRCKSIKNTDCDGDQQFFRVLFSSALDNDTLPPEYIQSVKASMDKATFELYGLGKLVELRSGKVYKSFSRAQNVLPFEKSVDLSKPLIWTFDFNISYQMSALIQTYQSKQGTMAEVLDEIVIPESGPENIAREFIKRYPEYSVVNNLNAPPIYMYGDPTSLNRESDGNEKSKFQIIYDILVKEGFKPQVMVKKIKGKTLIPVAERVDSVNTMLCNAEGIRRLFVSKACVYTIKSFEGVKYTEKTDKPTIDKQCDDNAARNPDKKMIHTLTHITDAIGYWVVKVDSVMKPNVEEPYVQIPGEGVTKVTEKGNIIEKPIQLPEEYRPRSLMEDLRSLGLNNLDLFG